ncbi:Clp protease [Klosneuvirus KNV1]|uniref:Clp protease n=1 Tax=Klosneuvirus KNV1 TaxID=1977640 RepID=A0A1V0SIM7_9VIRU|nr:Clp protease [Klosneuvirus KNV1]
MRTMKTLVLLALILCGLAIADHTIPTQESDIKLVELTENNFVAIRGQIDESTASRFISDVMKLKSNRIYVYLTTPGGSVISGMTIVQTINTLQASGKEFVCIADRAASMGFVIFQSCAQRYVMEHSIIMQHQVSLGIEGQYEQVKSYLKLIESLDKKMTLRQAKKLGLTPEEFHTRVQHDWWLHGEDILDHGAADEVVNVICDFDTTKTYDIKKYTFFGEIDLQFSLCPLIHNPTNIKFKNMNGEGLIDNVKQKEIINDLVDEYTKFDFSVKYF